MTSGKLEELEEDDSRRICIMNQADLNMHTKEFLHHDLVLWNYILIFYVVLMHRLHGLKDMQHGICRYKIRLQVGTPTLGI